MRAKPMFKWMHNMRMINKTKRALYRLSDRDLKDIGINRGEINAIATNWKDRRYAR